MVVFPATPNIWSQREMILWTINFVHKQLEIQVELSGSVIYEWCVTSDRQNMLRLCLRGKSQQLHPDIMSKIHRQMAVIAE